MKKRVFILLLSLPFFSNNLDAIGLRGATIATLGSAALAGEGYVVWKKAQRLSEISHFVEGREWPGRVQHEKRTWHLGMDEDYQFPYAIFHRQRLTLGKDLHEKLADGIKKEFNDFMKQYEDLDVSKRDLFLTLAQQDLAILENFKHELKGDRNFLMRRFTAALNNTFYYPISRHINGMYQRVCEAEQHLKFIISVVRDMS